MLQQCGHLALATLTMSDHLLFAFWQQQSLRYLGALHQRRNNGSKSERVRSSEVKASTCELPMTRIRAQSARSDSIVRLGAHLALQAVGDHVEVVGGLLAVLPRVGDAVQLVRHQVLALLDAQLQLRQPLPVLRLPPTRGSRQGSDSDSISVAYMA